jgi:hypothetical protein
MRRGGFFLFSGANFISARKASSEIFRTKKETREFLALKNRIQRRLAENQAAALLPAEAFWE